MPSALLFVPFTTHYWLTLPFSLTHFKLFIYKSSSSIKKLQRTLAKILDTIMKKIDDYRTLLQVEKAADLKTLKTSYRNVMKEWHPDKFQADAAAQSLAEEKSKKLIEAYHFLVSIAPETMEQNLPQYTETINTATIINYQYKDRILTLQIDFSDGNSYEYFDVPKGIYTKLHNAETQGRFARRHICTSFVYRNMGKLANV